MSSATTTIGALLIALPILGWGVAPRIFTPPETPSCKEATPEPAVLNGQPALSLRPCQSPFLIVWPNDPPSPVEVGASEEPQFNDSPIPRTTPPDGDE